MILGVVQRSSQASRIGPLSDLIWCVTAHETSLKNAAFVFKYGFGVFFCFLAVFIFNPHHPYGTAFVSLGFVVVGIFFLSVARVKPRGEVIEYRNWFRWHTVSYSEILDCGESWVFGYIKIRRYLLPWGKIYFVRSQAADSLFGWDKE